MANKLVSVVMSTYNEAKYIRDTISSILGQTYKDLELIIIDDGSVDETPEILKEYLREINVKINLNRHTGNIGKNLNDCIRMANGEIIAIMGADDKWKKEKIEIQMEYMQKEKIVCSNGQVIDGNDKVILNRVNNFNENIYIELPLLLNSNCILASSVLAYKYILEEAGLFDEEVGNRSEDYALWLNIAKNHKIKFINQILVGYRVDGDNLSIRSYHDKKAIWIRNLELITPFTFHKDINISNSAKAGIATIYCDLARNSYFEGFFNDTFDYSKNFLTSYSKKISIKYLKYMLLFLFAGFSKIFRKYEKSK